MKWRYNSKETKKLVVIDGYTLKINKLANSVKGAHQLL